MNFVEQEALAADIPRPMRLAPKDGESLRGYVYRLADNEACSSDDMRHWLGLPAAIKGEIAPTTRATTILQMERTDLNRLGADFSGHSTIAGLKVPSLLVHRRTMRICPECFSKDVFHRRIWDFGALDVCPIHKIELNDRCSDPGCGRLHTWDQRRGFAFCVCGAGLIAGERRKSRGSCVGAALLYARFGIEIDGIRLPEELQQVLVNDLLEMSSFLGRMEILTVQKNPSRLVRSSKKANFDSSIMDAGAEVLLDWPTQFYKLAKAVHDRLLEDEHYYSLSRFHDFIERNAKKTYGSFLRKAYREFLASDAGFLKNSRLVDRRDFQSFAPVGEVTFPSECGRVGPGRMPLKVRKDDLRPALPSRGRSNMALVRARLDAVATVSVELFDRDPVEAGRVDHIRCLEEEVNWLQFVGRMSELRRSLTGAYESDWECFEAWCKAASLRPLPADIDTVCLYISTRTKPRAKSRHHLELIVLRKIMAAIVVKHRVADLPFDGHDRRLVQAWENVMRLYDIPDRGVPLDP